MIDEIRQIENLWFYGQIFGILNFLGFSFLFYLMVNLYILESEEDGYDNSNGIKEEQYLLKEEN